MDEETRYILTERLALHRNVESPYSDCPPWMHGLPRAVLGSKLALRWRVRRFFKRFGCGWLTCGKTWRSCRREQKRAEEVYHTVLMRYGIVHGRKRFGIGRLYAERAAAVAETVAFFATSCSPADIANIVGGSVADNVSRIYAAWKSDDGFLDCMSYAAHHGFVRTDMSAICELDEPGASGIPLRWAGGR